MPSQMLGIHLQQARNLGVDWDSFLRNITFCKVSAQKDRSHCWIYFSKSFLPLGLMQAMLSNKSSIKVSLFPFASWSHHLCLHLKGFIFSPLLLFPPYCNNLSACRTCLQSYASRQKTSLGRNAWLPYPPDCHSPPLHTLTTLPHPPQIRPSSRSPLELSQKRLG